MTAHTRHTPLRARTGPGLRLRAALPLLVLAALAQGCALSKPVPSVGDAEASNTWVGRLSLWLDGNPPQVLNAGFELAGQAERGELLLTTPLGSTAAHIEWREGLAELRAGDRHERHASLSALTQSLAGTVLPVGALFEWLAGRQADADGWTADLTQHAAGRIEARRTLPGPSARLRLVFDVVERAKSPP